MRPGTLGLLLLLSCAAPAAAPEKEDPSLAIALLGHANPSRREEGACRLSRQGGSIPASLGGHEQALRYAQEDTASIRQELSAALEEQGPERMVWRAYHALRAGSLARDWSGLSDALARQGFRFTEIYEPNERAKFVRFLAQSAAYVNGAGDRHDLFFWVQSVRKEPAWIVREVYVGLSVQFNGPFKHLAAVDRYPRASVLGRFFELPELQRIAAVYPVLEEIEFTYGRIRDRESDSAPAGFHVNAGFAMEGKAGGRGLLYTAEGGLDPREDRRGRLAREGFFPSDLVGPLTARGSGFWGSGGPRPSED